MIFRNIWIGEKDKIRNFKKHESFFYIIPGLEKYSKIIPNFH